MNDFTSDLQQLNEPNRPQPTRPSRPAQMEWSAQNKAKKQKPLTAIQMLMKRLPEKQVNHISNLVLQEKINHSKKVTLWEKQALDLPDESAVIYNSFTEHPRSILEIEEEAREREKLLRDLELESKGGYRTVHAVIPEKPKPFDWDTCFVTLYEQHYGKLPNNLSESELELNQESVISHFKVVMTEAIQEERTKNAEIARQNEAFLAEFREQQRIKTADLKAIEQELNTPAKKEPELTPQEPIKTTEQAPTPASTSDSNETTSTIKALIEIIPPYITQAISRPLEHRQPSGEYEDNKLLFDDLGRLVLDSNLLDLYHLVFDPDSQAFQQSELVSLKYSKRLGMNSMDYYDYLESWISELENQVFEYEQSEFEYALQD